MLLTMTMMGNDDERDSVTGDDGDLEYILCVIILMMLMFRFSTTLSVVITKPVPHRCEDCYFAI